MKIFFSLSLPKKKKTEKLSILTIPDQDERRFLGNASWSARARLVDNFEPFSCYHISISISLCNPTERISFALRENVASSAEQSGLESHE